MTIFRGLPWLHIWAGRKSFGQFCSSTLPCTVSQANSPTVCRFTGGAALDVFGVLFYHLDLEQRYTVPRLLLTFFATSDVSTCPEGKHAKCRVGVAGTPPGRWSGQADQCHAMPLCHNCFYVSLESATQVQNDANIHALTQTHARATTHTCKYVDMHIIIYTRYKHGI